MDAQEWWMWMRVVVVQFTVTVRASSDMGGGVSRSDSVQINGKNEKREKERKSKRMGRMKNMNKGTRN